MIYGLLLYGCLFFGTLTVYSSLEKLPVALFKASFFTSLLTPQEGVTIASYQLASGILTQQTNPYNTQLLAAAVPTHYLARLLPSCFHYYLSVTTVENYLYHSHCSRIPSASASASAFPFLQVKQWTSSRKN